MPPIVDEEKALPEGHLEESKTGTRQSKGVVDGADAPSVWSPKAKALILGLILLAGVVVAIAVPIARQGKGDESSRVSSSERPVDDNDEDDDPMTRSPTSQPTPSDTVATTTATTTAVPTPIVPTTTTAPTIAPTSPSPPPTLESTGSHSEKATASPTDSGTAAPTEAVTDPNDDPPEITQFSAFGVSLPGFDQSLLQGYDSEEDFESDLVIGVSELLDRVIARNIGLETYANVGMGGPMLDAFMDDTEMDSSAPQSGAAAPTSAANRAPVGNDVSDYGTNNQEDGIEEGDLVVATKNFCKSCSFLWSLLRQCALCVLLVCRS